MSNDPAYYFAQRSHELYFVSPRATVSELLRICRLRGIVVMSAPFLDRPGWYVKSETVEVIFIREWSPWVLAHELFHAWMAENISHGIVYPFSDYAEDDVEAAANRFACLMCGPFEERASELLQARR